jgi:hypothetical protein
MLSCKRGCGHRQRTLEPRSICRWGWQFLSCEALDEAHVPFFGAFGAALQRANGEVPIERQ